MMGLSTPEERSTAQQWLKELWEESRTQSQALLSLLQRRDKKKYSHCKYGKFRGNIRQNVVSVRVIKGLPAVDTGRLRIVRTCRNSGLGPEHPPRADHAVQRGGWTRWSPEVPFSLMEFVR